MFGFSNYSFLERKEIAGNPLLLCTCNASCITSTSVGSLGHINVTYWIQSLPQMIFCSLKTLHSNLNEETVRVIDCVFWNKTPEFFTPGWGWWEFLFKRFEGCLVGDNRVGLSKVPAGPKWACFKFTQPRNKKSEAFKINLQTLIWSFL